MAFYLKNISGGVLNQIESGFTDGWADGTIIDAHLTHTDEQIQKAPLLRRRIDNDDVVVSEDAGGTSLLSKTDSLLFVVSASEGQTLQLIQSILPQLQAIDEKDVANGYAPLDSNVKVPLVNMPDSVLAGLEFKGGWDASTNTPTLASGVGSTGDLYKVSVAGSTSLDGISSWAVGDMVIFGDGAWNKIDNTETVTSVHGRIGSVVGADGDYTWKQVLLGGSTATIDQNVYLNAQTGQINFQTGAALIGGCNQRTLVCVNNYVGAARKWLFESTRATGTKLRVEDTAFIDEDGATYDAKMVDDSLVRKEWIDDKLALIVPPSVQTQSPIVIDGVTTAPTKGTTVQDEVRWIVSGDKVHCKYRYGQSTNGANGSGHYLWKLPDGLSFNATHHTFVTSSVNAETYLNNIGRVIALNTQNNWKAEGVVVPYDATHFRVLITQQNNSASSMIQGSSDWTFGSKPYMSIEFDFWKA